MTFFKKEMRRTILEKYKICLLWLRKISPLGPKIWELLPSNIEDSENPENCPCRLCKLYIADIGFIEL